MSKKRGNVISKSQLEGFTRQNTPKGRRWVRGAGESFETKAQVLAYLRQTGGKSMPGGKLTDQELAEGKI